MFNLVLQWIVIGSLRFVEEGSEKPREPRLFTYPELSSLCIRVIVFSEMMDLLRLRDDVLELFLDVDFGCVHLEPDVLRSAHESTLLPSPIRSVLALRLVESWSWIRVSGRTIVITLKAHKIWPWTY